MIKRLDHIGIAVRNLEASLGPYEKVLGLSPRILRLEEARLLAAFIRVGDVTLELLQPLDGEEEVSRFLAEHGEGVHHLAYEVEDIRAAMELAARQGLKVLDERPRRGVEGQIAFVDRSSMNGVQVEFLRKDREGTGT